jgi:type II secretion system protein G
MFKKQAVINFLIVIVPLLAIWIVSQQLLSRRSEEVEYIKAQNDLSALQQALDEFKKDVGRFPTQQEGFLGLVTNPNVRGWNGPYTSRERITDPWGNAYVYVNCSASVNERQCLCVGSAGQNRNWDTKDDDLKNARRSGDDIIKWIPSEEKE